MLAVLCVASGCGRYLFGRNGRLDLGKYRRTKTGARKIRAAVRENVKKIAILFDLFSVLDMLLVV